MRDHISALVDDVIAHPDAAFTNRSQSARELAAIGDEAAQAVLSRLVAGWQSEAHPRDVIEALAYVLQLIAEEEPELILDMSRREDIAAEPHIALITWALWNAAVARRKRSLPTSQIEARLRQLLSHGNEHVRFAASYGSRALDL